MRHSGGSVNHFFLNTCTVEPPNRGHLGEMVFVLILEVVLISEAKPYHAKCFMQHLLCKCLLLQNQSKQSLFQYTSIISIQSNIIIISCMYVKNCIYSAITRSSHELWSVLSTGVANQQPCQQITPLTEHRLYVPGFLETAAHSPVIRWLLYKSEF